MAKLYNLARMSTATTGTGTITLGSAASGFLSFASAGVTDGDTVTYAIEDGNNREIGRGVYTAAGTTLTRSVLKSTNANAAISLSGSAQVFITAAAEDLIGGTDGQLQYNSNGSLAGMSGVTWNDTTRLLTMASGTITASQPLLNLTQTWNNAAVNFTGLLFNVTDTTSGSSSLFADWQVGGVSRFQFGKNGNITFDDGASGNPVKARIGANGLLLRSDKTIQWSSNTTSSVADTWVSRGGAATVQLGQADAAAPISQSLQVQSVSAGTSNTAGVNFNINGSRGTGTGVGGSLVFQIAPAGSSGTAQNAYVTAFTIAATKVITVADTFDLAFSTTTGSKIGTATGQKIGFWNATPIAQPTTAVAGATVAATGTGDVVAASTTFGGYTIPQVVQALRNAGLLA